MKRSSRLRLAGVAVALTVPFGHLPAQDADLILRNARIWTGDSAQPFAQALAVRGAALELE
mgnify:CR=1 FL=1